MAKFNFDSLFQNKNKEIKKAVELRPSIIIENIGEFKFDTDTEWFYGPQIELNLPKNNTVKLKLVAIEAKFGSQRVRNVG